MARKINQNRSRKESGVQKMGSAGPSSRSAIHTSILTNYDEKLGIHAQFREKCEQLVAEILDAEKIRVHSVSGRVKDRKKLEEKLRTPGKEYSALDQITDVVGLRIITYFDDDVDSIANIITREFDKDVPNCIDKRKSLEPDQFGYLSLHYVCKLSPARLALPEYHQFRGLVFELQIRSLLQHTWAEIEHDLGYKAGVAVPKLVRRRFSLVAGLLETADKEFREIRDTLSDYESMVSAQIVDPSAEISLDQVSLAAFVKQSMTVRQLDAHLAKGFGGSRVSTKVDEGGATVKMLAYAGILTIGQLRSELESQRTRLAKFEEIACGQHCKLDEIESGLCLFHLAQVLMVLKHGVEGLAAAFRRLGYVGGGGERAAAQEVANIAAASGFPGAIASDKPTKHHAIHPSHSR